MNQSGAQGLLVTYRGLSSEPHTGHTWSAFIPARAPLPLLQHCGWANSTRSLPFQKRVSCVAAARFMICNIIISQRNVPQEFQRLPNSGIIALHAVLRIAASQVGFQSHRRQSETHVHRYTITTRHEAGLVGVGSRKCRKTSAAAQDASAHKAVE